MMSRAIVFVTLTGSLAMLYAFPASAAAHDGHHHQSDAAITPAPAPLHEKAREYFTDLPVIAQDGRKLRFYTDVLKDKVVLVSLFYTSCPDACPLITAKMAAVQDLLGEEFGKTIHFVSVTVDPETDTPAVIRDYADHFQTRNGWLFLTGDKQNLTTITHRLGQPDGNVTAHPPFLLAGDTRRGYWRKLMPNIPDEPLAEFLRDLADGS